VAFVEFHLYHRSMILIPKSQHKKATTCMNYEDGTEKEPAMN
jgi:hypothetical protein